MKRMPEHIRNAVDTLKAAGFAPEVIESKHYKIRWFAPNKQTLTLPRTPSDWRAKRNGETRLKKLLAAMQPLPVPLPE